MRANVRYRLLLVVALAVSVLNAWLAAHSLGTMLAADHWLAHTLEVITSLSDATEQIALTNSSSRGYLLEPQPKYLERFQNAERQSYVDLARLKTLTADNKVQRERLAVLEQQMHVRFATNDAAINMRRAYGPGVALPATIMDPILSDNPDGGPGVRVVLREVREEEQRLLSDRQKEVFSARREVWITFGVASVLDLVLIIIAFELLVRAARSRERLAETSAQVLLLNGELTKLNSDLESRVEARTRELAISNQELEAFSYSVSHDLRAPLRTIDGFSLALDEDFADKLGDEGRDYIRRVRSGVQRMGLLIDALLQLSRVTRSDLKRERVDISQLATMVFNETAAGEPARSVLWVAQPGVLTMADPRLLRVAFENLLGNAWKFTSRTDNALVRFGVEQADTDEPIYFVRDNGAGFDMKYVDRLFTAFQRLHGDRDFQGSGIGLATVSRIIHRHHGRIWAEGEPGKGAAFFFTLGQTLTGERDSKKEHGDE